jgi:hypothetical protein
VKLRMIQEFKYPFFIWLVSRFVVLSSWGVSSFFTPGLGFKESWLRWDGAWYYSIISGGYSSAAPVGPSNIAFFPGLPNVGRAISLLPRVSEFSGIVIACLVFGLTAVLLFWRFAMRIIEREEGVLVATFLFSMTPGSVVFSMIYSEGLFISLSIFCLLQLSQRRFLIASIVASVAGLVRPSAAVLILIVVVWSAYEIKRSKNWQLVFAIMIAPIGILSYAVYLQFHVGSMRTYFDAQRLGWGESFSLTARLEDVRLLVLWIANGFGSTDWNRVVPGLFLVLGLVGFYGCLKLRLPKVWIFYVAGIFAMSFFSQTLGFRPRFFMTAFPLFVGLTYFMRSRVQWISAIVVSTSALSIYSVVVFSSLLQTP